jgi:hypothetical protein
MQRLAAHLTVSAEEQRQGKTLIITEQRLERSKGEDIVLAWHLALKMRRSTDILAS